MRPNDLSYLLSLIEESKIDAANIYITANRSSQLEEKDVLNILIKLCNHVFKGHPSTGSCKGIHSLTQYCCESLKKTSSLPEKYLSSLYYILKYLFHQVKSVEWSQPGELNSYILDVTEHILVYLRQTNDLTNTYRALLALYHREVVQYPRQANLPGWEKLALKSLELHKLTCTDKYTLFFTRLNTYCTLLSQVHPNSDRKLFCSAVTALAQDIVLTSDDVCYDSYGPMLALLLALVHDIPADVSAISECAHGLLQLMKSMFVKDRYLRCIMLIEDLFTSVLKPMGERTEKDHISLNSCVHNLTDLKKTDARCPVVAKTCCTMVRLLKVYINDYFEKYPEQWELAFEPKFLLSLFALLDLIGDIVAKSDVVSAVSVLGFGVAFVTVYLKLKIAHPDELHASNLKCLDKCFRNFVKLQESAPDKFQSYWRYLGPLTFNAGAALYTCKRFDLVKSYYSLLAKYIICLEGLESSTVFEAALPTCVHVYASALACTDDYRHAMTFCALLMHIAPAYVEKALALLVNIKSKNEHLKEITVKDLLQQDTESIRRIYAAYEYDEKVATQLLFKELEYYHTNWPSKVPMHQACSQLFALTDDVVLLTRAFYFSSKKLSSLYDKQYIETLQNTIDRIENSEEREDGFMYKVCLACLYYVLYQCRSLELLERNAEDMSEAAAPQPLPPTEQADEDECLDIVPTYSSLNIQAKLDQLEYLSKCLALWDDILDGSPRDLALVVQFHFAKIIKLIAFEFRKQHFLFHMMRAWFVYLKYNQTVGNQLAVVESIGFILEYLYGESVRPLDKLAEDTLDALAETNSKEVLECRLMFLTNKSFGLLKNGRPQEAYRAFHAAQRLAQELASTLPVASARLLQLKAVFLLTPCSDQFLRHKELYLVAAQDAFTAVANMYKNDAPTDGFVMSLLLDISLSNGWIYKWLRLPREVRCYTKELLSLSQKLVLPIRAAQFISLQAYTDLLDRHFSDCEVKLDGLTNFLNYRSDMSMRQPARTSSKPESVSVATSSAVPVIRFLDADAQAAAAQCSGSPVLNRKPFAMPNLCAHPDSCTCLTCTNFEYHALLFELVHLEANLCYYTKGRCARVEEYFRGAFLLEQKLNAKYKHCVDNCTNREYKLIFENLPHPVHFSYCILLLDYTYYLAQQAQYAEARSTIHRIIERASSHRYNNIIFLNEVRCQDITLRYAAQHKPTQHLATKMRNACSFETVVTKTPDDKVVATKVRVSVSPLADVQPLKALKGLKLNFSDSEGEADDAKATPTPTKQRQKNCQCAATPAFKAPEIKVSMARVATTESLPNTSRVRTRALEQRTKILTEKLKTETQENASAARARRANRCAAQKENVAPSNDFDEIVDGMGNIAIATHKTTKPRTQPKPKRTAKSLNK